MFFILKYQKHLLCDLWPTIFVSKVNAKIYLIVFEELTPEIKNAMNFWQEEKQFMLKFIPEIFDDLYQKYGSFSGFLLIEWATFKLFASEYFP